VAQRRRSNPSHITVRNCHRDVIDGKINRVRILKEIKTSHKTYTNLHSIYVGYGAIHNKTQAHELVNILCDLTPTLQKLHMPGTTTEIGLRAAKSLAIRGLALRDSIQLVTWLHGLPTTGAKEFLTLIRDSPRATVLHILEGCEQIALLNLVTQGYLPDKSLQEFGGHPIGKQLVPLNLIRHIQKRSASIPKITTNIITYDPLIDNGEWRLPHQRPFSTHPKFRPTVKRGLFDDTNAHLPGEIPCTDLEYDDLEELYGYDEERGLSELVLEKGTEIEIPLEDEYGAITWVAGTVTSTQRGSLDFQVKFPGSAIDSGTWTQTRSRAEMEGTWRLPPTLRRRQPGVHAMLSTQGYTPWHHGSHWLRLQPRGAWKYKTQNVYGIPQGRVYGWRMGLSVM